MTHQKDLFAVSEAQAKPVKLMDMLTVKGIRTLRDAFRELLLAGGHTHESAADSIGKNKEQITKFLTNASGLKGDDLEALINECGSMVVAQYLANKSGFVVVERSSYEAMKANYIETLRSA